MKNILLVILSLILFSFDSFAQMFEIDGGMKVMVMNVDNACDSIVVRRGDGTLALRELSSISTGGGGSGSGGTNQTLSISNNVISLTNGGSVTLPADQVDDADADATNELQTLSISNDTIFLSDGEYAVLPASSGGGGSNQTISINNNTISLTNGGSINLPPDNVDDADADATNELQALRSSGDTIFIEPGQPGEPDNYIVLPGLKNLAYLNTSIQERLNRGATPLQIYQMGFPLDSIYGRIYKGGHIFYLDLNNEHPGFDGLVAATGDIEVGEENFGIPWGCTSVDPIPNASAPAPYTRIGDGTTNTATIIMDTCATSTDAAPLAQAYDGNGGDYNDWFLPSILELVEMYNKIGPGAAGPNFNIGNFKIMDTYWSSSVGSDYASWRLDFDLSTASPSPSGDTRTNLNRIRAVRTF